MKIELEWNANEIHVAWTPSLVFMPGRAMVFHGLALAWPWPGHDVAIWLDLGLVMANSRRGK